MYALIVVATTVAAEACPAPVDRPAWLEAANAAELAWVNADLPALQAGIDLVLVSVPCLSERLRREDVAQLHRLVGLAAVVARDTDAAQRAFAAARSLEPDFAFPPELVPPGNPIALAYAALPAPGGTQSPVPAPARGEILFDAEASTWRPTERPTLLQLVAADGTVSASAYLRPGDAMPGYPARAVSAGSTGRGARLPLLVGASVGMVTAASLYAGAFATEDAYYASTDLDEMERLRGETEALAWTAAGVGLVATATGALAVFGAKW